LEVVPMSRRNASLFLVGLGLGLVGCGGGDASSDSAGYGNGSGGDYAYLPPSSGGSGGSGGSSTSGGTGGTNATQGSGAAAGTGVGKSGGGSSGTGTGGSTGGSFATGGSGGSQPGAGGAPATGGTGATSGEKFEDPGTNPFVLSEHDPLSTFGVDVDTASYDIFRRDIEDGRLPAPESVRLEEFVNVFDYEYPAPTDEFEDPFSISLVAGPGLYEADTTLLRVGIQGKLAPEERGPANLVFLVDVSGSMASADKLPFVKIVLTEALEVLEPTDVVSIVTYAGSTAVVLEPTPVTEKQAIVAVIQALGAGGGTAGGAGLTLAYQQAERAFVEGGINHIVLCTDGDFNVGLSSDEAMLELITEKRTTGVTLTALGFGSGNLNDSMMEKVSNAGNGMYSVISSEDQAIAYANDRLLSTMLHIAKDMKVQVEFNHERVLAYRLLGYEDRAIADDDFRDDVVDAGEIGVGHRVTALYELVLGGGVVPAPEDAPALLDGDAYDGPVEVGAEDLVLVKIRYKQPGAAEADEAREVALALAADAIAEELADVDADYRWAAATAAFAEILKGSPYARPDLLEGISEIVHEADGTTDPGRAEFISLFDRARTLLEAR
jgi:Ca-activated chloride channel family protein